jgi:hypothetical protein
VQVGPEACKKDMKVIPKRVNYGEHAVRRLRSEDTDLVSKQRGDLSRSLEHKTNDSGKGWTRIQPALPKQKTIKKTIKKTTSGSHPITVFEYVALNKNLLANCGAKTDSFVWKRLGE